MRVNINIYKLKILILNGLPIYLQLVFMEIKREIGLMKKVNQIQHLKTANQDWLQKKKWIELFRKKNLPIQIFRLSGIYSSELNIFNRIKSGSLKIVNKPNHFFSRIHVEDIANILTLSLDKFKSGEIYNVSDDYPCSNEKIAIYALDLLEIEKPKMIEIDQIDSEMIRDFYKDSKKVSNKKIKNVFSYKLTFSTYNEGLREIYNHLI